MNKTDPCCETQRTLEENVMKSRFIDLTRDYGFKIVMADEKKPTGLDPYFDLLFEASNRKNIEQGKLSIYDKMIRDEIQIAAERDYAVREGRKEGFEQGRAEANLETARKLKQAGSDIELICQCTGLSHEEVEAL